MTETDLLPCPFCGSEASVGDSSNGLGESSFFVCCSLCCASTDVLSGYFYAKEEAYEMWNTRKKPDLDSYSIIEILNAASLANRQIEANKIIKVDKNENS